MRVKEQITNNKEQKLNNKNLKKLLSVICYLLSDSTGQTIIELLIAFALITLFLSGVVVIQLLAVRNVQYAQRRSIATKLAGEQLERARVVRDSSGIDALAVCLSSCFINAQLTPIPISPTGIYGQILKITSATSADCPAPAVTITPIPVVYKTTATVNWGQGSFTLTPAPELSISSCITDWR